MGEIDPSDTRPTSRLAAACFSRSAFCRFLDKTANGSCNALDDALSSTALSVVRQIIRVHVESIRHRTINHAPYLTVQWSTLGNPRMLVPSQTLPRSA